MAKKSKKSNGNKGKGSVLAALLIALIAAGGYAANKFSLLDVQTWKNFFGKTNSVNGELQVHFIDVGQGDCSLIISQDTAILIDCGESENGEKICEYLTEHNVPDIDYFLLTHPHSDHMGSASYIIDNTDVKNIIIPKVTDNLVPTTKFYEKFLKSVQNKNLKITPAKAGTTIDTGNGELEIIAPVNDYDDLNNYSAASVFTHGNNSFLITGDIEKAAEKDILEKGYFKDIDVLKVSHHGSSSSSTKKFLETVKPDYAVIMCDGHSYGHPHKETLEKLSEYTDKIYRTDIDGTIVFTSGENGFEVKTEK